MGINKEEIKKTFDGGYSDGYDYACAGGTDPKPSRGGYNKGYPEEPKRAEAYSKGYQMGFDKGRAEFKDYLEELVAGRE